MTILVKASHQWATRPFDERFVSLIALNDSCQKMRETSKAVKLGSRSMECIPMEDGGQHRALGVKGPDGNIVLPTHWSFSQLAQRAGAPAGYLRDLAAPIAADCINYGLKFNRDVEQLGVLLHKEDAGDPTLRAVTGPAYGRIWNAHITKALVDRFGDGLTGDFKVPGEFGKKVQVTKNNTTLYASDRDMFVFLCDEDHRIPMKNRRNGKSGSLARGFFMWNSEVGKCTFGVAFFLFDYVCANRIVWGAEGYEEITIRHTAKAPSRWVDEALPAIEAYSKSSSAPIQKAIAAAQAKKIGNEEDVTTFLRKRYNFSGVEATAIKKAHVEEEARPIETLWDAATGVTAYAKTIGYQDQRVDVERRAGKILNAASK